MLNRIGRRRSPSLEPDWEPDWTFDGLSRMGFAVLPNENALFAIFEKLPLELRQMIWKFALPDGRRVLFGSATRYDGCEVFAENLAQHPKYPGTLHANLESRQVTLEHYILPCHSGPFGETAHVRAGLNRKRDL